MTRKNATNDNDFSHQRNYDKERTMYFQEQKHILINFRNESPVFFVKIKVYSGHFLAKVMTCLTEKNYNIFCFNNGDIK
jgi:hypothetical protein